MHPEETFSALAARVVDTEHGFSLRGWRDDPRAVFTPASQELARERAWWMREHPDRHRPILHAAGELPAWALGLARAWDPDFSPIEGASPELSLHLLGCHWEADFVLLTPDATLGAHRFVAGSVCFPSGWAPEEKLGLGLAEVHGPVPGLNEALEPKLEAFLARLPTEGSWQRLNWGLSLSAQPNQHPALGLPRATEATDPATLWWRVEHQALVRRAEMPGVLFGIRVLSFPLTQVREHAALARTLGRQLRDMPLPLLRYKGLAACASHTAAWLAP